MTAASSNRRLSLPQIVRTPVSRSVRPALAATSDQRRLSVCVHLPVHPPPPELIDDNDDGCHGDGTAELLSEIHNCRNQLSQLVTSASQLEVTVVTPSPGTGAISVTVTSVCLCLFARIDQQELIRR